MALWLLASPAPGAADTGAQLPGGGSAAFRERMMAWSDAAQDPAPPLPPIRQAAPDARLPRLSSVFGYRGDPLLGTHRMHAGIDIPGPSGTPVQASAGGIVRFAGTAGGYGNMVEIDHGGGLRTRYAHLSRILVHSGDPIARRQTIGLMGSTGRSTGSHLHFEVRANGMASDPLAYFRNAIPPSAPSVAWRAPAEPHISRFARSRWASESPRGGEF